MDIARQFHTVEDIKAYIDLVDKYHGDYLQLHFSDNQNYAIESTLLNQLPNDGSKEKGNYLNPNTGKRFLSKSEIREIVRYAEARNVEIIPELDTPAHVDALLELLRLKGTSDLEAVKASWANQVDMAKETAKVFIENLIDEIIDIFGKVYHFHIGGDEFALPNEYNYEFVAYANRLNTHLKSKGIKARLWNDGILKTSLDTIDKDIEITYWSIDGDRPTEEERLALKAVRATPEEMINKGLRIINCNSYYLYFIPKENQIDNADANFAGRDCYLNWGIGLWESTNKTSKMDSVYGFTGAMVCIWNEDAGNSKPTTQARYLELLVRAACELTLNPGAYDEIKADAQAGFPSLESTRYVDLSSLTVDDFYIDVRNNGKERLVLLNPDAIGNRTVTLHVQYNDRDSVYVDKTFIKPFVVNLTDVSDTQFDLTIRKETA